MTSGIATALDAPHDEARLRLVVFLTDGFIGNEDEVLSLVAERMGASRLFAFGVGSSVNRYLLEEMTLAGRGVAQFVQPVDDAEIAAATLFARIDRPVLTDIEIDWGDLRVESLSPAQLPDLYIGQPLVVSGRYASAQSGTVVVRGRYANEPVRFELDVELPEAIERPAVAALWARRTIADLTRAEIRKHDPERVEAITQLALANKLMSRYTSLVAVDRESSTSTGEAKPVNVPVEVPAVARAVRYGASQGMIGYGVGGGGMGWGSAGQSVSGVTGLSGTVYGRSATVAKPKIMVGTLSVRGDLSSAVVRRYVRRKNAKVRHCYERALMKNTKLSGTAVATFVIESSGKVSTASVSGIGDSALTKCIAAVVRAIEFPSWTDGSKVSVTYPFELKPTGEKKDLSKAVD